MALATIALGIAAAAPAGAPAAEPPGEHSPNMTFVQNLPYEARNGTIPNYGTDIEFARLAGRQYALAGSYRNGLHIVDITDPQNAMLASVYDCGVTQGDVQVIRQADEPGRTFVSYTSDTYGDGKSTCYKEAAALGFDVLKPNGSGKNGTFIVEITDPLHPKTISFMEIPQGSHNQSIHPSGNYLYNSNSDLMTSFQPAIEIHDISDPNNPRKVGELSIPTRPGLGTESHDISFNSAGDRAYSAALSQGVIIDTSDPANPKVLTSFVDPAINVWHQMELFRSGGREFLIAEDEFAGAVGTSQCPNGGVHVYDVTGANENNPVKIGYWNIDDVRPTDEAEMRCTAHVFRIHPRQKLMTFAWYNGGVRVVDISGLEGIAVGDRNLTGQKGMKEIGFYKVDGGESWSAKTPAIDRRGNFTLYSNDIKRGLDVFRFEGARGQSQRQGRWMTPAEAATALAGRGSVPLNGDYTLLCLKP
jgi:hypothetical protein